MRNKRVNRQYKDRLFRKAFLDKKHLLELYNAINDSHYTNPDELIITTLEDAVYLGMKNDASFILNDVLSLWEHQSSYNPNMPVRGLSYFAKLYQQYIEEHQLNIYGSSLQMLPFPQYIVFYNGSKDEPDKKELRLSEAFMKPTEALKNQIPAVDVRAVMLNINWGRNPKLMKDCQRLSEYSRFVAKVREYQKMYQELEDAVKHAVDESIGEGILADILSEQKAEVIELFLTEYDEEKQRQLDKEEARREARKEAREEVTEQINRLIRSLFEQGRIEDVLKSATDTEYQEKLLKELNE